MEIDAIPQLELPVTRVIRALPGNGKLTAQNAIGRDLGQCIEHRAAGQFRYLIVIPRNSHAQPSPACRFRIRRQACRGQQRCGGTGCKEGTTVDTGHVERAFLAMSSMTRTSSALMPGSERAWPALRTILS